jgi:uncharacterized protein (DUF58 family)
LPGVTAAQGVVAGLAPLIVLAVVVALDLAGLPGSSRVRVEREFPSAIGVGDVLHGVYRVAVNWRLALHGALSDALPPGVRRETPTPQELSTDEEAVLDVAMTGRQRGDWELGRVAIQLEGPLRLVGRTYRVRPSDRILVTPSVANVRKYRLLAVQHRLLEVGVRVLRRRGDGSNFAGLREYVRGDDPRVIDWKASARREALITREFSIEQGQTVVIVIDCGRLMTQFAGDLPRFEYALSSALVLADIAVASGDHVGLLAFDDRVRAWVPPAKGHEAIRGVRGALVPLVATMAEPDYATAFRTLDARQRKRSLVVFFTDVIDPRSSQAVIAHTSRSARRHLPVVVALRNEAVVAAAARSGVETASGVYERAAAEELLSARDEALERMRQAGVSVVDVQPQAMTAAVVNRYLELKGRGAV